jgi:capsular polysaccharide biosynthesis protein
MDRMRLANVAVLSSPTVNEKPVGPKRLLTVALALAVGLAAGICCGLVLEWQSDVIYDGEDLNRDVPGSFLGALRPNGARPTETTRSGVGTV